MDPMHRLQRLLKEDRRFKRDAYVFIHEALGYAQNNLKMGMPQPTEPGEHFSAPDEPSLEPHLTGQQLCEAIRQYAIEQFGYLAKVVLNSWGVHTTGDIGDIVYNLIDIGYMKKSKADRREDFDNVFEFDEAFQQNFQLGKTS